MSVTPLSRLTPYVWEKWDGRLQNWALCFGGPRDQHKSERSAPVSDAYQDLENWRTFATDFKRSVNAGTWDTPEPPGITIDAIDTNALIILLPDKLYDAVDAFWHMSGPVEYRAAAIGVHVATLYRQRDEAVLELERLEGGRMYQYRQVVRGAKVALAKVGCVVIRTRFVPDDWAY